MKVDAHVHRYPEEVFQNPSAFAEQRGEKHWLQLVAPDDRPSIQGWADREKMIDDMDAAGLDKVVLLGWYWEKPDTCILQNEWHLQWMREDPQRFIPFAAAHPFSKNHGLDDLKRCLDLGFRGIGEMLPAIQGFTMQDASWLKIVEFAIEANWPINFHVSEHLGRPHPGRVPTPFEEFQWLAKQYPELKMILAHWGGLLPFYEFNPYLQKILKNVWYDVAASPLTYDTRVFRTMVDAVGPDKILYGSDYPLLLYPSRQTKPDFVTYLNEIQTAELSEEELEKILGGNLSRLLG